MPALPLASGRSIEPPTDASVASMKWLTRVSIPLCVLSLSLSLPACGSTGGDVDVSTFVWTEINGDAPWQRRAGLHVVELNNRLFLMGGRTPLDSPLPIIADIWADVWVSDDRGVSWDKILDSDTEGHWPERAYFQAVTLNGFMYVLGGQNSGFDPTFYNDVWRSTDGVAWTQMTANAGWDTRAGLRAVTFRNEIYIFGGSQNDDEAIVEIGDPPVRILYNDVWKSADGAEWTQMTDDAPWEPRAGAVVVVKGDYMILLGGEEGFVCDPPDCPYFNDVWRSKDGAEWELVTAAAGWSPRPGHQCGVVSDKIVCFGGFGQPTNPMDVWVSDDGEEWEQISDSPWNATSSYDVKYDFDSLVLRQGLRGPAAIYTFGGDREASFVAPDPSLVDHDVWSFGAPAPPDDDDERGDDDEGFDD